MPGVHVREKREMGADSWAESAGSLPKSTHQCVVAPSVCYLSVFCNEKMLDV